MKTPIIRKNRLKRKWLVLIRLMLLSIFVVCSLDFITTWIYLIVGPLIHGKLVGFTWIGLLINVIELFYTIWFIEYYEEVIKSEKC